MDWQIFQVLAMLTGTCTSVLINTTEKTVWEKAVGGSATLYCQFTLASEDVGPLEIEWTRLSTGEREDSVIIVYSGGLIYDDYYGPLKDRVYFVSPDPRKGDGSINLLRLTPSDSGTYRCQVKKVPGIHRITVILRVLHAPSKPSCYAKGTAEVGGNLVLQCKALEGAIPIDYSWQRTTEPYTLPPSAHLDIVAGTLNIPEAKESDSGTYHCNARNRVGIEECFLEVQISPPSMAGMISGSVVGIIMVLSVIASIVYCCCKRAREMADEGNDGGNDIQEDASPPRRRKLVN